MRLLKYFVLLMFVIFMVSCEGGDETSSNGSGSEIVGDVDSGSTRITFSNSRLAVDGAKIYLFKSDYKSIGDESSIVETDPSGNFVIDSTVTEDNIGKWILEASTPEKSLVAICNVKGDGMPIELHTLEIQKKAKLDITIKTNLPGLIEYTVYILGTRNSFSSTKGELNILMPDIPTGLEHRIMLEVTKPIPLTFYKDTTLNPGATCSMLFNANN